MRKYPKDLFEFNPIFENNSFSSKQIKDTTEKIGKNTYKKTVEAWVKKNNAVRNAADREKLEERLEMFLKSLKGFTDWDTEGGTIKDWEDYQLKRWEAYKDLTKADKDLPESLTKLAEARKYMKQYAGKDKGGRNCRTKTKKDEKKN